MTRVEEQPEQKPPQLPRKLADRIANAEYQETDELIVGDGEVELKSTQPVTVVEYFISANQDEWSEETFKDYSYDLTRLLEYCAYAQIDDLRTLSSRDLEGFKHWRKKDGNIVLSTLHGQLSNIRVFIRDCERLELVEEGLADEIEMPDLDNSDIVSYVRLLPEQAEAILEYHQKHDYAKRRHAEFALTWSILSRLGGARSLDLDNYAEDDEGNRYVEFEHDPEQDTPLKNGANDVEGEGGERQVNVPDWVCEILDDYIDNERIDATDDYGRQPLFTTDDGRVSKSTIRRDMYRITQPCRRGEECPHGIDPSECNARNNNRKLAKCPSTVSPHPIRRGGICHQLKQGVPKDTICEKADVSRKVLNKHYDIRSKEEARIQRRDELRKHLEGYDSPKSSEDYIGHSKTDFNLLAEASPLVADLTAARTRLPDYLSGGSPASLNPRLAKGVAGYAAFVLLTGLDMGLIGAGFDPIAMNLIFQIW